jgi:DNA-3-methyladenine glycosylase
MAQRRPKTRRVRDLASGPGKLTLAMAITRRHNGADVITGPLVVRALRREAPFELVTTKRIGISASRDLPLRFHIKDNKYVSGL